MRNQKLRLKMSVCVCVCEAYCSWVALQKLDIPVEFDVVSSQSVHLSLQY